MKDQNRSLVGDNRPGPQPYRVEEPRSSITYKSLLLGHISQSRLGDDIPMNKAKA